MLIITIWLATSMSVKIVTHAWCDMLWCVLMKNNQPWTSTRYPTRRWRTLTCPRWATRRKLWSYSLMFGNSGQSVWTARRQHWTMSGQSSRPTLMLPTSFGKSLHPRKSFEDCYTACNTAGYYCNKSDALPDTQPTVSKRWSEWTCFTVSGIPQDWQVGESSPLNKYEWVRREWPNLQSVEQDGIIATCWSQALSPMPLPVAPLRHLKPSKLHVKWVHFLHMIFTC